MNGSFSLSDAMSEELMSVMSMDSVGFSRNVGTVNVGKVPELEESELLTLREDLSSLDWNSMG